MTVDWRNWRNVPMPPGIAARPRDVRGFPITFVTLISSDGRPDFTIVDRDKIVRCIQEGLCGLCGLGWTYPERMAFIGGPLSIENQNFLDPPMHVHCAEYAMRVCPHIAIASSRYSKPKEAEALGVDSLELFTGVHPDRPDRFGMLLTSRCQVASYAGQPVFIPEDPVEVIWQEALAEEGGEES